MNLNDMDPYDVIARSIDEDVWESQPWNMGQWHPCGAHFWHCQLPLNIVVTDWTDDNVYDINIYTDTQMYEMNDALSYNHMPIESAGTFVVGLTVGGMAERLYRASAKIDHPPHRVEQAIASYMEIVRRDPDTINNVAGSGYGHYGQVTDWSDHRYEIAMEIDQETTGVPPDELAEAAINICRHDVGLEPIDWRIAATMRYSQHDRRPRSKT